MPSHELSLSLLLLRTSRDEELLSLAAEPNSLTEQSRPLLADELLRLNKDAPEGASHVCYRSN